MLCTDVTAHGVDIPDVDWVIQYAPPLDPKIFVHICGRTALQGKMSHTLIYLQPNEDNYIEFLHVRKVPIEQYPDSPSEDGISVDAAEEALGNNVKDLEAFIVSNVIAKDRAIFQAGKAAFISAIRSYLKNPSYFS